MKLITFIKSENFQNIKVFIIWFLVGILFGYIGVTVPLISVKQCHFERSYNYIKN